MLTLYSTVEGVEHDGVTPRLHMSLKLEPGAAVNRPYQDFWERQWSQQELHFQWDPGDLHRTAGWLFALESYDALRAFCVREVRPCRFDVSEKVCGVLQAYQQTQWVAESELRTRLGETLWALLRPFQRTAVHKALTFQHLLIADEMGAGKTLEALATVHCVRDYWPVCVVCPSFLLYTWRAEIEKWLQIPSERVFLVRKSSDLTHPKAATPAVYDFMLLSYALAAKPALSPYWRHCQVLIFDECHYMKSRLAKRSVEPFKVAARAQYCLFLSGTPGNYHADFYMFLKHMYPTLYPTFFQPSHLSADVDVASFASRFCKPQAQVFQGRTQWQFKGYTAPHELQLLLHTRMIRRRKRDILTQLPPKVRFRYVLPPLPAAAQKAIDTLLKKDAEPSKSAFMESWRLTAQHKMAGVSTVLKEYLIEELLVQEPNAQALVFFHHQMMLEGLKELCVQQQVSFCVIDGSTPLPERQQIQQAFQTTSQYRIALLSIQAAGTGLTLTQARYVFFTELLFGPDVVLQAEDRAHRIGQLETVHIFYLLQPRTPDEINWRMIERKELEMSKVLDTRASYLKLRPVPASLVESGSHAVPVDAGVGPSGVLLLPGVVDRANEATVVAPRIVHETVPAPSMFKRRRVEAEVLLPAAVV
jgi:SWI/SNF-related matrix-associated actin-dependent regulator 1 of chromatin subfamily A